MGVKMEQRNKGGVKSIETMRNVNILCKKHVHSLDKLRSWNLFDIIWNLM